ncbi:MAG: ribosome recycling factor [Bacteroidetes bacterium]|nr:ribosome recycling factor [Bacteroidota bacterium]
MNEDVKFVLEEAKEQMKNAITHLEFELQKIRAGKSNPQMLDSVRVDSYGTMSPLSQVANINTPDPKTLIIQPWDKNMLVPIEKAIMYANLGFNPQNDGIVIRIIVPPLTEERRKDLVKRAKVEIENTKVAIRNIRRDANESAKKLEKDGTPEDMIKKLEADIQEATNSHITKVDKLFAAKETDIMTV